VGVIVATLRRLVRPPDPTHPSLAPRSRSR
jgi:hypothetical protein